MCCLLVLCHSPNYLRGNSVEMGELTQSVHSTLLRAVCYVVLCGCHGVYVQDAKAGPMLLGRVVCMFARHGSGAQLQGDQVRTGASIVAFWEMISFRLIGRGGSVCGEDGVDGGGRGGHLVTFPTLAKVRLLFGRCVS
jgi:hypothetical protein